MRLNRLTQMARDALEKRGGMDAIKQDLQEAKEAARGHDGLMDKAKAAAGAFKQPGTDPAAPHDAHEHGAPAPAGGTHDAPAAPRPDAADPTGPSADPRPPSAA